MPDLTLNQAPARTAGMALQQRRESQRWAMLAGILLLLAAAMTGSLLLGAVRYRLEEGWAAVFAYNDAVIEQMIIRTTRLPRVLIAAAVGGSLAVAGTIIQALTRNPLASPGILGINAGASFLVVLAAVMFSVTSMPVLMGMGFAGAALAAAVVFALGSLGRGGLSPMRFLLAGAAISALFSSFTQGILVLNKQGLGSVLFWLTGTIAGREPDMLIQCWPYLAVSLVGAWALAPQLNVLMMGEETAQGLGQRTFVLKMALGAIVLFLAGGSVSIAGPIGFIGVVVPHLARFLVGVDHRWVIPYSALLGALLLIAADLAARFIMMPEEVPVGVMTALLGAPFFIHAARKGMMRS
ncbi:MAG: Iron compound transporter, permease [Paenibacillaceae bacterium]|nr:Iron compound transporter, permease [Paenibacillaceae bacterium]